MQNQKKLRPSTCHEASMSEIPQKSGAKSENTAAGRSLVVRSVIRTSLTISLAGELLLFEGAVEDAAAE